MAAAVGCHGVAIQVGGVGLLEVLDLDAAMRSNVAYERPTDN